MPFCQLPSAVFASFRAADWCECKVVRAEEQQLLATLQAACRRGSIVSLSIFSCESILFLVVRPPSQQPLAAQYGGRQATTRLGHCSSCCLLHFACSFQCPDRIVLLKTFPSTVLYLPPVLPKLCFCVDVGLLSHHCPSAADCTCSPLVQWRPLASGQHIFLLSFGHFIIPFAFTFFQKNLSNQTSLTR